MSSMSVHSNSLKDSSCRLASWDWSTAPLGNRCTVFRWRRAYWASIEVDFKYLWWTRECFGFNGGVSCLWLLRSWWREQFLPQYFLSHPDTVFYRCCRWNSWNSSGPRGWSMVVIWDIVGTCLRDQQREYGRGIAQPMAACWAIDLNY